MMNSSKIIAVEKCTLHQGDGGLSTFKFKVDRFYNDFDLSELSAILKLNFSNDTVDSAQLEKIVSENEIELVWHVERTQTVVSGETEGQVVFENGEGTIVLNSQVFVFNVENSLTLGENLVYGVTLLDQLKDEINEKLSVLDNIEDYLSDTLVRSVNDKSGDVVLTADDLNAAPKDAFEALESGLLTGDVVVKKAEESTNAQCDERGNNIFKKYLMTSQIRYKLQFIELTNTTQPTDQVLQINLLTKYRRLFVYYKIEADELETPINVYYRIWLLKGQSIWQEACCGKIGDITIYENPLLLNLDIEMLGRYCRVEQRFSNSFASNLSFIERSSATIGVDFNQHYIEGIKIAFYDENDNPVYPYGASLNIMGVPYNS